MMRYGDIQQIDPRSSDSHFAKKVVVIGAGGHGKVVVSTLQAAGIEVNAIYDDNQNVWGQLVLGVPVCGPISELAKSPEKFAGIVGIGNTIIRQRLVDQLNIEWLTAIHPRAFVHESAQIGPGSVVFAGAVIQPDAIVGKHVIVNTSASIDHDCRIGDFVGLGPGTHLSGSVRIEDRTLLGTGCSVLPNLCIGADVVVGAGTVVIRDVSPGSTLVGPLPRIVQSRGVADSQRAA